MNDKRGAKCLLTVLGLLVVASCASVISGDKAITSFGFLAADNAAVLSADCMGVINGTDIAVSLPTYTDRSSLVATFTSTGVGVKVDGVEQESGVTVNDFGLPLEYVVTASDASKQTYTVTVNSGDTRLWSPGNVTQENFGRSVAIDGDYAVVGAPLASLVFPASAPGNAYVFHRTGPGIWDAGVELVSSGSANGDYFGRTVSISGDYAIVGAPGEDAGASDAGAAYVFHRTGTNTWDAGAKLVAPVAQATGYFGCSVAIRGDYAIVGAVGDDTKANNAGAAFVFHRTGTNTWDAGVKLTAADGEASDNLGCSVSITVDYAIVGAPNEDAQGADAGAAYLFRRTGTNAWDTGLKRVAPDAQAGDFFGYAAAIDGDYAIVGAYWEDTGASNAGAAYVFHRTGPDNVWDAGVRLVRPDTVYDSENFGYAVSISGSTALVGAQQAASLDGTEWTGAAYEYQRTGTNSWNSGLKFVAPDAANSDNYGCSVSVSGEDVIVGAWYKGNETGAAYVWE